MGSFYKMKTLAAILAFGVASAVAEAGYSYGGYGYGRSYGGYGGYRSYGGYGYGKREADADAVAEPGYGYGGYGGYGYGRSYGGCPSCCCCPSCLCCCPSCLCSCSSCCCHLCCRPSCCFSLRILPEDMYKQDINFIQRRYLRHVVLNC